jgi:hypothetical protein
MAKSSFFEYWGVAGGDFVLGVESGQPLSNEQTDVPTDKNKNNMAKFSKLLGGDPAEFTPAQAGAAFASETSRMVREEGLDLTKAWAKAKMMHPEVHARMCEAANPTSVVSNDDPMPTLPPVPTGSKSLRLPAFHLPPTTSNEIFTVAWRANGNQSMSVNSQAVFHALVVYFAKTQSVPVATAQRMVVDEYPELARKAGQVSDKAAPSTRPGWPNPNL